MPERCIMIFPQFKNMSIINKVRMRYDPLASHVRPHITLVFPFSSDIESDELKEHLKMVLSGVKPFRLVLRGITPVKSFENYLFLNIEDGKEEITDIHRRLYTGILEKYLPPWLKSEGYLPHMTVGKIESEEEYKYAVEDTKCITDVFETIASKVSVEIIDENEDSIMEMEINLGMRQV